MNTLRQEIEDLINDIGQAFSDMYSAVSKVIAGIPDWMGSVRDAIVDAWNYACEKIAEFWEYMDDTVNREVGNPEAISDTADRWSKEVGGPVSGQVAVAEAANLDADNTWQGDAAEAYRERVSFHKDALAAIHSTFTNGIAGALDLVQVALVIYFVAIIGSLAELLGMTVLAILAVASIYGSVPGLAAWVQAIVIAIVAITGSRIVLECSCRSAKTSLNELITDCTAFGGDHWPAGAAVS